MGFVRAIICFIIAALMICVGMKAATCHAIMNEPGTVQCALAWFFACFGFFGGTIYGVVALLEGLKAIFDEIF